MAPNNPNGMGLAANLSNAYGQYGASAKDYTYNDPAPRYTLC